MEETYIGKGYFNWLYSFIGYKKEKGVPTYIELLSQMARTEFVWLVELDANRAEDALDLRTRFMQETNNDSYFAQLGDPPCTVFEVLMALIIRCEDHIMEDSAKGPRYGQWFWEMITNLGLGQYNDETYIRHPHSSESNVDYILQRFLYRDYNRDGSDGGLFTFENRTEDMRKVDIWYQMMWYLASLPELK